MISGVRLNETIARRPVRLQPNLHAPIELAAGDATGKTACAPEQLFWMVPNLLKRLAVRASFRGSRRLGKTPILNPSARRSCFSSREPPIPIQTPKPPKRCNSRCLCGAGPGLGLMSQGLQAPALQAQSPRTTRGQFEVMGDHDRREVVGGMQALQQVEDPA
jgi:hypothetical protein